MVARAESAAATRSALLRAASGLLDEGGPEAVTLRAVGARAGVSRGAPYGHFEDKAHLLLELVVSAWNSLTRIVDRLHADEASTPATRLEQALVALLAVARRQPHVYTLMFNTATDDPAASAAASQLGDQFLSLVRDVVGAAEAAQYAALVLSSAHGIASLEIGGQLTQQKWQVSAEQQVRTLISSIRADASIS